MSNITPRAIGTGIIIGAALTPCNIYSGLKIGWAFNMSIAAGLIAAGFWGLFAKGRALKPWSLQENNLSQTTTSSAASIISGGLVAPIPALTILTGATFGWPALTLWVFAVSMLGLIVAWRLRAQMIEREALRFPAGVATAEILNRIHTATHETGHKVRALLGATLISGLAKFALDLAGTGWQRFSLGLVYPAWSTLRGALPTGLTFNNLTFAFDPSLLMIGFGAMIGMRAALSLMAGALIAWAFLGPLALSNGWVEAGAPETFWFSELVTWLLWPGATLIVVSSLTSFTISASRLIKTKRLTDHSYERFGWVYITALAAITILITLVGWNLFGLSLWECVIAVALSYVLAIVSARVTGETGITPVGALGKVTQLSFGVISPGNVSSNLMSANITGGAAGQCADLMHDLKTGHIIGAKPSDQLIAQAFGIATGAVIGTAVYLLLVPDPKSMLITPDWPAPAVATWKAVAEVLADGLSAIPTGATTAMFIAGFAGVILAVTERLVSARWRPYLPSAPAIGLGFVIPAWNAMSMMIGALLAYTLKKLKPHWAERYTITIAAGLVAGESLVGIGLAIWALRAAL